MVKKTKASNRRNKGTENHENEDFEDSVVIYDHKNDGSESNTNDSQLDDWERRGGGNRSTFSIGGSDTMYDDEFTHNDNDDDNDDMELNDRIIQRGDPGNEENIALVTSNRIQAIRDTIEGIGDIRSNRHEIYLRRCCKVLSLYGSSCGTVGYDIVSSNIDSIIEGCLVALRSSSSSSKQYAACRFIEVASIVVCNSNDACMDHWITSMYEPLRRIIISSHSTTSVRMTALRALSLSVFMATVVGMDTSINNNGSSNNNSDDDGAAIESLLDLCEVIATNQEFRNQIVPNAFRATAYDCWALLAATLDDWTISGQDDLFVGRGVAILIPLQQAVEETKADAAALRTSAAECLSLIHEARINLGIVAVDDNAVVDSGVKAEVNVDYDYDNDIKTKSKFSTANNATARRYQKGSWENSKHETLMDEVKQRIAELANESSHRISKKDKKEQRSNFREYMTTIVDDESPELVIKFRNSNNNNNGQLELSSWKEIIPVNCLRNVLQSGFQTHLVSNPAIQQLFHVPIGLCDSQYSSGGNMSQIEKRLLLSKNSETYKNADQDRHKKRDKRQNIKNHFLTADGDDI